MVEEWLIFDLFTVWLEISGELSRLELFLEGSFFNFLTRGLDPLAGTGLGGRAAVSFKRESIS